MHCRCVPLMDEPPLLWWRTLHCLSAYWVTLIYLTSQPWLVMPLRFYPNFEARNFDALLSANRRCLITMYSWKVLCWLVKKKVTLLKCVWSQNYPCYDFVHILNVSHFHQSSVMHHVCYIHFLTTDVERFRSANIHRNKFECARFRHLNNSVFHFDLDCMEIYQFVMMNLSTFNMHKSNHSHFFSILKAYVFLFFEHRQ